MHCATLYVCSRTHSMIEGSLALDQQFDGIMFMLLNSIDELFVLLVVQHWSSACHDSAAQKIPFKIGVGNVERY